MLNSGDSGNHWLMIEACGHQSNRDAIGMTVSVTTTSGWTAFREGASVALSGEVPAEARAL
jgi:hypothetical protein